MAINLIEAAKALLRLICIIISCATLLSVSLWIHFINRIANTVVSVIEKVTGIEVQSPISFHRQRQNNIENVIYENPNDAGIINSKATLSSAGKITKYSPPTLIAKTQKLLAVDVDLGSKRPDLLADDFQAIFPFVGPLDKNSFCATMLSFNRADAFPPEHDCRSNYFGFMVDPTELNRVWYFARPELVHRGNLKVGRLSVQETYLKIQSTAQVFSMSFDDDGKCYKFTGGYPVDRSSGNCDGLGGLFGILHCIKPGCLPFPEGYPWTPSLEWQVWHDRVPMIGQEWKNFLDALGLRIVPNPRVYILQMIGQWKKFLDTVECLFREM